MHRKVKIVLNIIEQFCSKIPSVEIIGPITKWLKWLQLDCHQKRPEKFKKWHCRSKNVCLGLWASRSNLIQYNQIGEGPKRVGEMLHEVVNREKTQM